MPPMRTSSLSEPSCSIALIYLSVACPCSVSSYVRRARIVLCAVNITAPAALMKWPENAKF